MTATGTTRLANLRDVADGLPAGTLRPGLLLRSDAPDARDADPDHVAWPPAVVLDLRSAGEAAAEHPLSTSARVHSVPVYAGAAPTALLALDDFPPLADSYAGMLAEGPAGALVQAVGIVAEADGTALIHCAVGKDRTGVLVALILRLLDVDRTLVAEEYLRTNAIVDSLVLRPSVQEGKYRDKLVDADGVVSPLMRADLAAIDLVMDTWDEAPGGPRGWYLAHGGTQESLEALRRLLP